MRKEKVTEEKLKRAVKNDPERFFVLRTKEGKLVEVHDRDTGYVCIHGGEGWFWIG